MTTQKQNSHGLPLAEEHQEVEESHHRYLSLNLHPRVRSLAIPIRSIRVLVIESEEGCSQVLTGTHGVIIEVIHSDFVSGAESQGRVFGVVSDLERVEDQEGALQAGSGLAAGISEMK